MRIKQLLLLLSSLVLTNLISGCGSEPQDDTPTNSTKGLVGSSSYIINTATTYQDITGVNALSIQATTAGGTNSIGGFAAEKSAAYPLAPAEGGYVTTGELRAIIALIGAETYLAGLSTINEQVFTKYAEFTVGDYSFTTTTPKTPAALANDILNTLGATSVSAPSGAGGTTATAFRMFVTVTSFNAHYYYTVSISPSATAIFEENFALMTALSSGTNYTGTNERLVSKTESFSGKAGTTNQADFLFVVDDSGSMGDQQAAISTAANDFEAALNLAGMNYNLAIITTGDGADAAVACTDNCYDRSVQKVGIIDNDINLFKLEINDINTSGSPQETGIYNAEQALKQTANGDSFDGLLNTAPLSFPRADTQLSMIILSDEVSQYESRAGTSFNASNNLFTRDGILVNSIIDTGLCGDDTEKTGQYDDLAIATGGLVGNICNGGVTPNFSAVMQNIVFQAAGAYKLSQRFAKPNSIEITVDSVASTPSIRQGYMYIEGTNSIAFFGTLPAEGSIIEVYYEYPKALNLFDND